MTDPAERQDDWLRFELWSGLGVHDGLVHHVFREAARVEQVPKQARHTLLLPSVLEALDRLVTALKLSPPPEVLPDGVLPSPRR